MITLIVIFFMLASFALGFHMHSTLHSGSNDRFAEVVCDILRECDPETREKFKEGSRIAQEKYANHIRRNKK